MSAFCHEYVCGCIFHQVAGFIRRCEGQVSRSLSGRMIAKQDNSEKRHNDAMADVSPNKKSPIVRTWEVAAILP